MNRSRVSVSFGPFFGLSEPNANSLHVSNSQSEFSMTTSTIKMKIKHAAVALSAMLGLGAMGCSRAHIEAIELSNEADQQVKVDTAGAIQKYEQAISLDPTNHLVVWKLSKAYEKKEDWDKMASSLAKAIQVAPEFANYWERRGYALTKLAEAGNPDAWNDAKEPLKKCIEIDPNRAWCYFLLAEAEWWTDDAQSALQNYTKAIEHDPRVPSFYVGLADAYQVLRFYDEASKVVDEGTKNIEATEESVDHVYNMFLLSFNLAQVQGDKPKMLAAVKQAYQLGGENHPEAKFFLGSTLANMDPPQKEQAKQHLESFSNTVCKGAKAKQFRAQCAQATSLLSRLGS